MPSFYPSHMSSNHHLPTPPLEYGHGYKDACYQGLSEDYASHFSDYHASGTQQTGTMLPDPFDRFTKPGPPSNMYQQPQAYSEYAQPMGAPMLPPLRIDGRYMAQSANYHARHDQSSQAQPDSFAAEEKPLGGVSATLDYEMEQMTDFVVEATVGMYELCASPICIADIDLLRSIRPGSKSSSAFRKWVASVLNATRLPSATIILSLSYLARRVRQLSAEGSFKPSEAALYRMLTTSMILGSKFLDDNTFQNKSWAEVSNIGVKDINQDERDWLMSFNHRLHNDPKGIDGYDACSDIWLSFKSRSDSTPMPLQRIDTNVQRHGSLPGLTPDVYQHRFAKQTRDSFPVDPRLTEAQYSTPAYSPYDSWYGRRSAGGYSPPSAPHSGPHTPEYFDGESGWGPFDRYNRSIGHPYASMAQSFAPQAPHYANGYGNEFYQAQVQHNHWNCHGALCQCTNCRYSNFMPRYGPIVVG